MHTCEREGCDQVFPEHQGPGRPRRYCSKSCSNRAAEANRGSERTCEVDGCEQPHRARGYCRTHYRQWERANGKAKPPSDKWGPRRRAHWKKRHAIKRGAIEAETIYPESIYERDGWVCRLCGLPVDRALEFPDPMCASLDHKRPLKDGGTHTRANVQLAHFRCNAAKGSKHDFNLTR